MEIIVLKDTILTESEVSPPNFEENIVVMAAVGAEAEMVIATKTSPLIPQKYIPNNTARGKIKSFKAIEKRAFKFLIASNKLLFAKWYPIIIIGMGVLRPAMKPMGWEITGTL